MHNTQTIGEQIRIGAIGVAAEQLQARGDTGVGASDGRVGATG